MVETVHPRGTVESASRARRLIVNADDFGQSAQINRGIIRAHEHGILTSASLMVRWPEARAAAEYARAKPALSVGLHIDLGEWAYRDAQWIPVYSVVPADDPEASAREVRHQLDAFRDLMGREPTHLDSHQHVHASAPLDAIVAALGTALGIPVRGRGSLVRYEGAFYGQDGKGRAIDGAVTAERLIGLLRALPVGTTELGCHPGIGGDGQGGMYVVEREQEVHALCDPRVRSMLDIEAIELVSFHDVHPAAA